MRRAARDNPVSQHLHHTCHGHTNRHTDACLITLPLCVGSRDILLLTKNSAFPRTFPCRGGEGPVEGVSLCQPVSYVVTGNGGERRPEDGGHTHPPPPYTFTCSAATDRGLLLHCVRFPAEHVLQRRFLLAIIEAGRVRRLDRVWR